MAQTLHQLLQYAHALHLEASRTGNQETLVECLNRYNFLLNSAPEDPHIIFLTGTVNMQLGNNGAAIAMIEHARSLVEAPQAEFLNNLGSAWKAEHDNEKAEYFWKEAMKINEHGDYYNNLSTLHINEGSPDLGLAYADKAVEMSPENDKAHWNRSLLLLEVGRMQEGFEEYDYGLKTLDRPNRFYNDDPEAIPYYNGEDLKGKTIVVYGEQGLGDEIMFASAITDVIATGANVIYDCHDRLESVMRRSFPNIVIYPTRKKNTVDWPKDHVIDYRIGVGSLFLWFGTHPRKPYLKADPKLVRRYRTRLKKFPKPWVGFGYAGGAKKTHAHKRSSQLTPLMPILEQKATFISLQYTFDAEDKFKRHADNTGIKVTHWAEAIESHIGEDEDKRRAEGFNYDHTIALIKALDLVVVPNTTAVHVCGAVGTEVWTMTPDACAWRYLNSGDHMTFYEDHVHLYREKGDNKKMIKRLAKDLKQRIGE